MEYFHPKKLLTFKLLLSWRSQPFQMGPEKMEYLILSDFKLYIKGLRKDCKVIKKRITKYKIAQSKKTLTYENL